MSKIKSTDRLYDMIDKEYTWRLHEIDLIKGLLKQKSGNPKFVAPLAKALVVLSYSHWEGFVKCSTEYFFEYMIFLNLKKQEMNPKFVASCLQHLNDSRNSADTISMVYNCLVDDDFTFDYNPTALSSAESNLNYDVLRKISANLAIDISSLEPKKASLDQIVLTRRNNVAHGDNVYADEQYGIEVCGHVLDLMRCFKDILQNYISVKGYRK